MKALRANENKPFLFFLLILLPYGQPELGVANSQNHAAQSITAASAGKIT
jgi:hypothetical protein